MLIRITAGISSTVVLIVWAVIASNTPATNRFISKKEKLYIMKSLTVESSKQSLTVWLFTKKYGSMNKIAGRNFGLKNGRYSEGDRGSFGPRNDRGEERGGGIPSPSNSGSGRALWASQRRTGKIPDRKRVYCNLISPDRLFRQQVATNSSPFHSEKYEYGTPVHKKWGTSWYPSYPCKLRLRCKIILNVLHSCVLACLAYVRNINVIGYFVSM